MNNFENCIIQDDMNIISKLIDYSKFNNKTFLVTGSSGMLASYIVYVLIYLNENIENFKCNIILVARSTDKLREKYGNYLEKDYIKIYISNLDTEIEIEDSINYIIHAASIAQTQFFSQKPIDVINPNTIGTKYLLDLAAKKKIESFLYFSTCSIYGKILNNNHIDENTYGILDPLDINSCYSESKRLGETMCKAYFLQKDVKTKIARISHTYRAYS
jgi:nucleoside-diphosphate-sugar epimerase